MTEGHLAVSPNIEKGKFEVCQKVEDQYYIKFSGNVNELADCLFGWGIMLRIAKQGADTYIVLNESDYEKLTESPDYDV